MAGSPRTPSLGSALFPQRQRRRASVALGQEVLEESLLDEDESIRVVEEEQETLRLAINGRVVERRVEGLRQGELEPVEKKLILHRFRVQPKKHGRTLKLKKHVRSIKKKKNPK